MRRTIKLTDIVLGIVSFAIVAVTSPLLFWLGRSEISRRSELVVDPDLWADDPGIDVDGDPE